VKKKEKMRKRVKQNNRVPLFCVTWQRPTAVVIFILFVIFFFPFSSSRQCLKEKKNAVAFNHRYITNTEILKKKKEVFN
jgi:hypothetical protein